MEATESQSQLIKFHTVDEQEVLAEKKLVMRSMTVNAMIVDGFDPDDPIPLPEITKKTFEKVLDYLKHVDAGNPIPEIEKPLRSNDMRDVTTEFYASYIDLNDDEVQDIILAANYLDIKDLLALGCAKMGSVIRGLTIPEFRKRFNIVNDFTPEEEAEPFDESKLAELAEAYEKQ
jgi:Skp1 family, tetramerisation domain/Skp1 family, dimerisation domain